MICIWDPLPWELVFVWAWCWCVCESRGWQMRQRGWGWRGGEATCACHVRINECVFVCAEWRIGQNISLWECLCLNRNIQKSVSGRWTGPFLLAFTSRRGPNVQIHDWIICNLFYTEPKPGKIARAGGISLALLPVPQTDVSDCKHPPQYSCRLLGSSFSVLHCCLEQEKQHKTCHK